MTKELADTGPFSKRFKSESSYRDKFLFTLQI